MRKRARRMNKSSIVPNTFPIEQTCCHLERSEGPAAGRGPSNRSFASLRMTRGRESTRREFLAATVGAAVIAPSVLTGCAQAPPPPPPPLPPKPAVRPKVALVGTVVRKLSHAQHFVDRLLEGYGWHGEHHYP